MNRISFGADAGHLCERLLEQAGTSEVAGTSGVVGFQPESMSAVLDLLREGAEGRWVVEVMVVPGTQVGQGTTIMLDEVDEVGLRGFRFDEQTGDGTGPRHSVMWRNLYEIHIF